MIRDVCIRELGFVLKIFYAIIFEELTPFVTDARQYLHHS